MTKTAELVWLWVKQRPYIQEALERKIANYSAVARMANREVGASEEAVKMALIRISGKLIKKKVESEKKILYILKNSSLEIQSKIAIVISRDKLNIDTIASAKAPSGFVSVVEEKKLPEILHRGIIEIEKNMDMIKIISPREIEKVPGVVSYLLSSLAAENISLFHIISCYKDNLLITHEVDTTKAFKILSEKVR